jgi:hypothetical protein
MISMTYSVIVASIAMELSVFVADDDNSALKIAEQNYFHHDNDFFYLRNASTNKLVAIL